MAALPVAEGLRPPVALGGALTVDLGGHAGEGGQVAEGVVTARSAWALAQKTGVDMPITEQVYRMLYEDKPVRDVLRDLVGRERKAERG